MSKKVRKYCANPLFEEWIKEWIEKAKITNKPAIQQSLENALHSLEKCPLTFSTGEDCKILKHFNSKLCEMIDKSLQLHQSQQSSNNLVENVDQALTTAKDRESSQEPPKKRNCKTKSAELKQKKQATTILKRNTLTYSILLVLYEEKNKNPPGFVTMKHLTSQMLQHLSKPSDISENKHWKIMTQLINDGLISKLPCPVRYGITDNGASVITKIVNKNAETTESDADNSFTKFGRENEEQNFCGRKSLNFKHYSDILTESVDLPDKKSEQDLQSRKEKTSITEDNIFAEIVPAEAPAKPTKRNTNKTKKSSEEQIDVEEFVSFVLESNTFDIFLLVDIHETNPKSKPEDDPALSKLESLKTNYLVRHLNVGDFAWIARCKKTKKELVLPYIVERKSADDLSSSIKDGRFHEQKFRLKRSGIDKKIYLVEGLSKNASTSLPVTALFQAAINSQMQDNFDLKFTNSQKKSMEYLHLLTKSLTNQFKEKRLISCRKSDLESASESRDTKHLMEFTEFNKSSSKQKTITVQEMLVHQLIQMRGLSVEKAMVIAAEYQTPLKLQQALIESGDKLLTEIKVAGKKAISLTISQAIHKLYTQAILN